MPDSVKDILLPHAGHADVYTSRASLCTNIVTPGLLQQPVCRMHSATLCRLQRVQDCAAILLCDASSRAHVSPLRQQLHWLSVHSRIRYELCMLCMMYSTARLLAIEQISVSAAVILDCVHPRGIV